MAELILLDETLDGAVAEAMEGMAFTDIERVEDGDPGPLAAGGAWASIDIIVPEAGVLYVVMGEEEVAEVAEATVGEADVDIETCLEVLCEMLNTLAGTWARCHVPDGVQIQIGLPKSGVGEWASESETEIVVYETDDDEQFLLALVR